MLIMIFVQSTLRVYW